MNAGSSSTAPYRELFERARNAAGEGECDACIAEIERRLKSAVDPGDRGRLLMCRARVRSNQWRTAEVFADARQAMKLFERAGEGDMAVDAASWAAAHASRMGELSVASELATRSLLALETVEDDELRAEILNRLGIFSISFLDYDRAIKQFEASLGAAERAGADQMIWRQLYNMADGLLLAARERELANLPPRPEDLARAEALIRELFERAPEETLRRWAGQRLLAEVLCEQGRPRDGLEVLDRYRDDPNVVVAAAQRAALAWVEARCLRLVGRAAEAVELAQRAVEIARYSEDDHELMLALEELAACQEAAGDYRRALATARDVKARMWTIHQRETQQLVQEVWGRADFIRDQATLKSQAAEASRRAEEDALTGIGNRRVLERFLEQESGDQSQVALLVLDIDRFKDVNDTFGHQVGDSVLRRIGRLLREEVRAHQVAVRYGGDEFVVALLGVDGEAAAGFAERLRRRVEELNWSVLAPELRVTASVGLAAGPRGNWKTVFSAADAALYGAKNAGRNRIQLAE